MQPYDHNNVTNKKSSANINARHAIHQLGYYGLLPFIFGTMIVWLSPWVVQQPLALITARGTLIYGGIIAAYMAGMSAGRDLGADRTGIATYLPGMLATLMAWAMILPDGYFFFSFPLVWRLLIVAGVFGWLYWKDRVGVARGDWPTWYGALRLRLTAWVTILLSAIVARLLLWGYI